MTYYIIYNNTEIYLAKCRDALLNLYPDSEIYELPEDYNSEKYRVVNGELVLNPNYEEEQIQKKREALNGLSLTKREVFLALYKDKGITPEQIKAQITNPEVLIEFEYANDYFRGNPLINLIGQSLGYTSEQLDYLFEHKELKNDNLGW